MDDATGAVAAALARNRVLPVLRVEDGEAAARLVEACVAAELTVVELTTTTSGWEDAVVRCRRAWPEITLGVGTVTDAAAASAAIAAGADFLVSPYPAPEVRARAAAVGVPFIEGGMTPGEVADAAARGIAKLVPAHVGGPEYLRSVLAVLPGARVVPTGGIELDEVGSWLDAGAVAVGVGRSLLGASGLADRIAALRGGSER